MRENGQPQWKRVKSYLETYIFPRDVESIVLGCTEKFFPWVIKTSGNIVPSYQKNTKKKYTVTFFPSQCCKNWTETGTLKEVGSECILSRKITTVLLNEEKKVVWTFRTQIEKGQLNSVISTGGLPKLSVRRKTWGNWKKK